jgi:hypothetical protein
MAFLSSWNSEKRLVALKRKCSFARRCRNKKLSEMAGVLGKSA